MTALTPRELQVLDLMAAGHTDQQIADKLYVCVDTAKKEAKRIYTKFGVNNRAAAVNAGWERKLLGTGEMDSARAMQVMAELLDTHAAPIHWQAWVQLLGPRFEVRRPA